MSRRLSRNSLLTLSTNLGLVAGIGMFGCGEARPSADLLSTEEVPNGIVGTLHARIASFEDGHAETYYRLVRDDGEEISLDFGEVAPKAKVGQRIAVRGPQEAKRIQVDALEILRRRDEQQQPLKAGPAKRNIRIAAISLSSADMPKAKYDSRVFTDVDSPTAFYRENSYGDWTFTGDTYGPYDISFGTCGDDNLYNIRDAAQAAAAADGFDKANYDNWMIYMPKAAGCSWGGIAEVGVNEVRGFHNAHDSWYNGNGCVVLAQELGHNFGLLHSHSCTNAPYGAKSYGGTNCSGFSEYGDGYTPMGGGCGHFNAPESAALGFISGCNTVDVTSSGTIELGPIEAKCAGAQVIRVDAKAMANMGPQYIYVEYRNGKGTIGSDSKSLQGIYFHASAEYGGNATGIDSGPVGHDYDYAIDPFSIHAPLTAVDMTWTEPSSGATFKLNSVGATASVEVTIPGSTPGAAKCIDGATPPSAPMCAAIVLPEGGTPEAGTPDSGGARPDAAPDTGAGGSGMADAAPDTGSSGTAGAGTGGTGGTSGTGGSGGSSTESGCNCSIPGASGSRHASAALLGLAALIPALRRRRARRAS